MKKIFTLIAAAMMAFTINAQSDITFGLYSYGGGTGTGGGTGGTGGGTGGTGGGTGGTTAGDGNSLLTMGGYSEQGSVSFQVTNDGIDTYTIKNFLGGSDFSFKVIDTGNNGGSTSRGNTVSLEIVPGYTVSTDFTTFKKNGADVARIKGVDPTPQGGVNMTATSYYSLDGKEIAVRLNVIGGTAEKYSGGAWTSTTYNNKSFIGAIFPVIVKTEGPTAIEDINADENAPVEYYNLQGMRINEPAAGQVVIRRQGSKVSKIVF